MFFLKNFGFPTITLQWPLTQPITQQNSSLALDSPRERLGPLLITFSAFALSEAEGRGRERRRDSGTQRTRSLRCFGRVVSSNPREPPSKARVCSRMRGALTLAVDQRTVSRLSSVLLLDTRLCICSVDVFGWLVSELCCEIASEVMWSTWVVLNECPTFKSVPFAFGLESNTRYFAISFRQILLAAVEEL